MEVDSPFVSQAPLGTPETALLIGKCSPTVVINCSYTRQILI